MQGIQVIERTGNQIQTQEGKISKSFLPRIIKIFQRVFDLQSGHETIALSHSNITTEDNTNSRKGRVVILVRNTLSCPVLHVNQIPSKYSKGYSSNRADIKSISKTKQRAITPKVRKPELSFLYMKHHLVRFYISTK